ncbi:MAG: AAA family ATPase [Candidatus Methanodesulfokora sp.]
MEMEIEVENFGPVSSGRVELKPLTVFIGPNNSGKSYTAMLIRSIFEVLPHSLLELYPPPFRSHFLLDAIRGEVSESLKRSIKDLIENLKEKEEFEVPKQLVEHIISEIFREVYEKRLSKEIIRSFASPLNELIKMGKNLSTLKIKFNSHNINLFLIGDKLELREHPRLDLRIWIKKVEEPTIGAKMKKENEFIIEMGKIPQIPPADIANILAGNILEICASHVYSMVESLLVPCYYLPAARSGILQGHKALVAGIMRKIPYVGIERLEVPPTFPGVVSDFLSSIISLPEEKGPFYQLARELEEELIRGEIVVGTLEERYSHPEIKYDFEGKEIPLHRASSTVSELAPLFLYLKYYIRPESVLVIEEPEAHLHPTNQRVLAKLLVRLVRKGVYVVITTHSEYLLEQLSNFILLSRIEPGERVKQGYKEDDFLKPKETAVYVFRYDEESSGYKIEEVKVTEEEGIPQDEFLRVHRALYEEEVSIYRKLGEE